MREEIQQWGMRSLRWLCIDNAVELRQLPPSGSVTNALTSHGFHIAPTLLDWPEIRFCAAAALPGVGAVAVRDVPTVPYSTSPSCSGLDIALALQSAMAENGNITDILRY